MTIPSLRRLRGPPPLWLSHHRRRQGRSKACLGLTPRFISSSALLSSPANLSFPDHTAVVFFSTLYPEANASAAGVRTSYLLQKLAPCPGISAVHYATATRKQPTGAILQGTIRRLRDEMGVQFHVLPPNRTTAMQQLQQQIMKDSNAQQVVVFFDRFYAEEMYSFHWHASNAVLVLDMQDLHSLRRARQQALTAAIKVPLSQEHHQHFDPALSDPSDSVSGQFQENEVLAVDGLAQSPWQVRPNASDDHLLRELASIHRCDLTLVCSTVEQRLLQEEYAIPASKLCLAPLFGDLEEDIGKDGLCEGLSPPDSIPFEQRKDFVFVGGFRHAPNVDCVYQLYRLWPRIRSALADRHPTRDHRDVQIHIYGAYSSDSLKRELHNPAWGFHFHGFAPSLSEALRHRRVLLAPLRFGAGIKGKIVDAWKLGSLPVVTTTIGAEGMTHGDRLWTRSENNDMFGRGTEDSSSWPGAIVDKDDDFVDAAVHLYSDPGAWHHAQSKISALLRHQCSGWNEILSRLIATVKDREAIRSHDYTRALFWRQGQRSTEYFSKYLECKDQLKEARPGSNG